MNKIWKCFNWVNTSSTWFARIPVSGSQSQPTDRPTINANQASQAQTMRRLRLLQGKMVFHSTFILERYFCEWTYWSRTPSRWNPYQQETASPALDIHLYEVTWNMETLTNTRMLICMYTPLTMAKQTYPSTFGSGVAWCSKLYFLSNDNYNFLSAFTPLATPTKLYWVFWLLQSFFFGYHHHRHRGHMENSTAKLVNSLPLAIVQKDTAWSDGCVRVRIPS